MVTNNVTVYQFEVDVLLCLHDCSNYVHEINQ